MQTSEIKHEGKRPTFKIAVGVSVALGFVQLMAVGVALTKRAGSVSVREVVKYEAAAPVVVRIPEAPKAVEKLKKVEARSLEELLREAGPVSIRVPKSFLPVAKGAAVEVNRKQRYLIQNPRVEKLVEEAREAREVGDMMLAAMKAEEALEVDGEEVAAICLMARIYRDLEQHEQTEELYLKVLGKGLKAGDYRDEAIEFIKHGPDSMSTDNQMRLGAVNIRRFDEKSGAKVTIPIRSKKGSEIMPKSVELQVHFYDKGADGKVVEAAKYSKIDYSWRNAANLDWNEHGEEVLEVGYNVPSINEVDAQLVGRRSYYGQVIELYYKGELQDTIAHPRRLHAIHRRRNPAAGMMDDLPPIEDIENFNQDNPLLPALPPMEEELPNGTEEPIDPNDLPRL